MLTEAPKSYLLPQLMRLRMRQAPKRGHHTGTLFLAAIIQLLFSLFSFALGADTFSENSTPSKSSTLLDREAVSTLRSDVFPKSFVKKSDHFEAGVRIETLRYLTEVPSVPELTDSQFVSGHISYKGQNAWFENRLDVRAASYVSPSESHWMVQELFTTPRTRSLTGYFTTSIGRKKQAWSVLDAEWDLGVWQPYYEMDALRPEQQGLTGVFFDFDQEYFQLLAFATPLFIPNMGPATREENGKLVTQSRWAQELPTETGLGGRVNTLNYKLTVPEAREVVSHSGYAMMTRVGKKDDGAWITSSIGYKPVNQLLIGRTLRKPVDRRETGIFVAPQVAYHAVFAADTGYSFGHSGVSFSYLQDSPVEQRPEDRWALQKFEPLKAFGAGIYSRLPALETRNVVLRLDYLKSEGGTIQDINYDGSRDVMSRDQQRLKFTNAFRARVQGEVLRLFRRPLVTQISWLYDQDQDGSMVNSEIQYFPSRRWAVIAGADFLGVDDENTASDGFLNQYRANDRVYGGVSYVF